MPFHLRKSIKAGPFRFNFSKGGVGASVGIRGLRIGTGPRGHYVSAGAHGVYYRATIGRAGERRAATDRAPAAAPLRPRSSREGGVEMIEVDSGDVLAMRDETSTALIDEINAKRQTPSMAALLGFGLAALGLLLAPAIGAAAAPAPALLGAGGWAFGRWLDSYRRVCVLFYDLDDARTRAYQEAIGAFDALASCAAKWHVEAGGAVRDLTTWKRNAGASMIVRKKPTTLAFRLPRAVTSNVALPALHVGRQIIFLMPDRALVDDGNRVGAVGYEQLAIRWQDSNFIETGVVPRDTQVIGHNWKHPNKSGGPDRRFRDNRQIPVCRYETMHLSSPSGVNESVEFSRTGVLAAFAGALKALAAGQAAPASPTPAIGNVT